MFRSLFIGLLILSALTAKGAGVQIKQNISDITPEMLLEFYHAFVTNADQQTENSEDESDAAFFRCISFYGNTIERPGRSVRKYAPVEQPGRSVRQHYPIIWNKAVNCGAACGTQCARISICEKPLRKNEVYQYGTDLSPPDYR